MKTSNDQSQNLEFLANCQELPSVGKLIKLYTLFFESVKILSTVTTELQEQFENGLVPLQVLKEKATEIDKVIGAFGSVTLTIEPSLDEIAILQEIKEKLHLTEPNEINYLEKRIHKLVLEISTTHKDKNLTRCLNLLKGKAWRLLESITDYAKKEYDYSL
jgi:ribosomal protein S15P/S13E